MLQVTCFLRQRKIELLRKELSLLSKKIISDSAQRNKVTVTNFDLDREKQKYLAEARNRLSGKFPSL